MTRIRDIAHRNDIPKDIKLYIKHELQNKLHRCADPGDLVKLDQLVERIDREGGYSEGFVREMHIFQVELRDFFNATGAPGLSFLLRPCRCCLISSTPNDAI